MAHESFSDSGLVIDSTLGFAAKTHFVRAQGAPLRWVTESIIYNFFKPISWVGHEMSEAFGRLVSRSFELN